MLYSQLTECSFGRDFNSPVDCIELSSDEEAQTDDELELSGGSVLDDNDQTGATYKHTQNVSDVIGRWLGYVHFCFVWDFKHFV